MAEENKKLAFLREKIRDNLKRASEKYGRK